MVRWPLLLAVLLTLLPFAAQAQEVTRIPPPFLILDQERFFTRSAYGSSLIAANTAEATALSEESRRLDRQFEEEERALTERRPDLDPEAFRKLADAFDEKVTEARQSQENKAQALSARADNRRRLFFRRAGPVLREILEQSGAAAIVESRSVLLGKQDLNITDEAIKRLDERIAAQEGRVRTPDDPAAANDQADQTDQIQIPDQTEQTEQE
jgi:Skp family chaperone for outer membrane proteins